MIRSLLFLFAGSVPLFPGGVARAQFPAGVRAPELVGSTWFNSAEPIRLDGRAGKVTVVHFWTFGCINCKRNLDAYNRWHTRFQPESVLVLGIHSPEFSHERNAANVKEHVRKFSIEYPVLMDNDWANWKRWRQQYWPAIYVVDKAGRVRYRWAGELGANGEETIAKQIEKLLGE